MICAGRPVNDRGLLLAAAGGDQGVGLVDDPPVQLPVLGDQGIAFGRLVPVQPLVPFDRGVQPGSQGGGRDRAGHLLGRGLGVGDRLHGRAEVQVGQRRALLGEGAPLRDVPVGAVGHLAQGLGRLAQIQLEVGGQLAGPRFGEGGQHPVAGPFPVLDGPAEQTRVQGQRRQPFRGRRTDRPTGDLAHLTGPFDRGIHRRPISVGPGVTGPEQLFVLGPGALDGSLVLRPAAGGGERGPRLSQADGPAAQVGHLPGRGQRFAQVRRPVGAPAGGIGQRQVLDLPHRRLIQRRRGGPDPVGDPIGQPPGDQRQPRVGSPAVGQLAGQPGWVDRRAGQPDGPTGGFQRIADPGEVGVQPGVGPAQRRRELLLFGGELAGRRLPGHGVGKPFDDPLVDLAADRDGLEGAPVGPGLAGEAPPSVVRLAEPGVQRGQVQTQGLVGEHLAHAAFVLADQIGERTQHGHGLPDRRLHRRVQPAGLRLGRVLGQQRQLGVRPGPAQRESSVGQPEQPGQVGGVLIDAGEPGRGGVQEVQQPAGDVGGGRLRRGPHQLPQTGEDLQRSVVHLCRARADDPAQLGSRGGQLATQRLSGGEQLDHRGQVGQEQPGVGHRRAPFGQLQQPHPAPQRGQTHRQHQPGVVVDAGPDHGDAIGGGRGIGHRGDQLGDGELGVVVLRQLSPAERLPVEHRAPVPGQGVGPVGDPAQCRVVQGSPEVRGGQ